MYFDVTVFVNFIHFSTTSSLRLLSCGIAKLFVKELFLICWILCLPAFEGGSERPARLELQVAAKLCRVIWR